uniref:EGF-like domain-containing protein n=1 Tax=Rhabditophanes sp. KR3021 TaxID=114890 RepID=A0AC35TYR9_9BILA
MSVCVYGQRYKTHDDRMNLLVPISKYMEPCSSGEIYGIEDGHLEQCEYWKHEAGFRNPEDEIYEKAKCSKLRIHGKYENGSCNCKPKWRGPMCEVYSGCDAGFTLYKGACIPSQCHNGGVLSIGGVHIECACEGPYSGRWCESLACWRKAQAQEFDRRWRNDKTNCSCGNNYEGVNCDIITSCEKGTLREKRCECEAGYRGEVCHLKCPPGQETNKSVDDKMNPLISLAKFQKDCLSGEVYGIENGMLEQCSQFKKEVDFENEADLAYEKVKCSKLRIRGELQDGKCVCEKMWKGSMCHLYNGCTEGYTLVGKACAENICQNGGVLAIGDRKIECICQGPYEGRWCERLACWRQSDSPDIERRYRNSKDKCVCSDFYHGKECSEIVKCDHGTFIEGKCECQAGYRGEICHIKCPTGQETCSANNIKFGTSGVCIMIGGFLLYWLH